jgi:hypothetical protein
MANGFAEHLHYLLTKHVIETGHAPDLLALSTPAGRAEKETEDGLRQLEQMHGVILVPNSTKVWSLHPFALMPSAFWVTVNQRGWWANCAWCSLAIGAALRQDVTITTSDGAEGKELQFNVESGRPSRSDLMLHFPYPPAKWWDNPYSPCGNILFFSSEANIDAWCERHGIREVQSWISKQASNWQSSGLETMLHWSGSVNLRFRQRQSSTTSRSVILEYRDVSLIQNRNSSRTTAKFFGKLQRAAWTLVRSFRLRNSAILTATDSYGVSFGRVFRSPQNCFRSCADDLSREVLF